MRIRRVNPGGLVPFPVPWRGLFPTAGRAMLGLLMLAMLSDSGQAHPHVWVTTRTELVFDAQGRLTHLRHLWEFDEAYSAFAVMGLDTNGDGQPDAAGLAESARTNLGSLQEFNYFTAVQIDRVTVAFNAPTEYDQAFTGGRLSLRFLLPLKGPAKPNTLTFKIEDPSFFVALSPTDGPDAVTMCQKRRVPMAYSGSQNHRRLRGDVVSVLNRLVREGVVTAYQTNFHGSVPSPHPIEITVTGRPDTNSVADVQERVRAELASFAERAAIQIRAVPEGP